MGVLRESWHKLVLGTIDAGKASILVFSTLRSLFKRPYEFYELLRQLYYVGFLAIPVVLITGGVVGLVSAVQAFYQLKTMSAQGMVGGFVSVLVIKELAPMLTAFVMAARVGTGFAAQLGTMKVTEQIDALRAMATSPVNYLVVPRFLACAIMMPILVIFADIAGLLGGLLMSIRLGMTGDFFIQQVTKFMLAGDIIGGLIKGLTFGTIIAMVGCHRGLCTSGGAEGVGQSTASSAVHSFILIIIADFLLNYGIYAILGVG